MWTFARRRFLSRIVCSKSFDIIETESLANDGSVAEGTKSEQTEASKDFLDYLFDLAEAEMFELTDELAELKEKVKEEKA